ncbi:universal stress protein [Amylibacter sp. SFDW26]|uniref:universal stress protein n=1 Tax=Amylibacter sp. SFDW26 TaxID=2652722 RepID=UPI001262A3B9|nr:universal stress protein [Amylibacter sp. SFDW26]KAB7613432.1 universal stress protein [Amylibacter sp. SFDW26]
MYKHILLTIAPDHERDMTDAFNVASHLSKEGGRITLFSVIEALPTYVALELPQEQMERNAKKLEKKLLEDAKELPGSGVEVIIGHSANSILEYAGKNDVDCIIVSSHRPTYHDYLLGSTASRVVRHATCAVHITR